MIMEEEEEGDLCWWKAGCFPQLDLEDKVHLEGGVLMDEEKGMPRNILGRANNLSNYQLVRTTRITNS